MPGLRIGNGVVPCTIDSGKLTGTEGTVAMDEHERLDRQGGNLAALEGAFALLVEHLAKAGALNMPAFITDLQYVADLSPKDPETLAAEQRILRTLRGLPHSR
jgi:hypothetical protein